MLLFAEWVPTTCQARSIALEGCDLYATLQPSQCVVLVLLFLNNKGTAKPPIWEVAQLEFQSRPDCPQSKCSSLSDMKCGVSYDDLAQLGVRVVSGLEAIKPAVHLTCAPAQSARPGSDWIALLFCDINCNTFNLGNGPITHKKT